MRLVRRQCEQPSIDDVFLPAHTDGRDSRPHVHGATHVWSCLSLTLTIMPAMPYHLSSLSFLLCTALDTKAVPQKSNTPHSAGCLFVAILLFGKRKHSPYLVAGGAVCAMTIATTDGPIIAGLEWELRDLLATVRTGPVALDHLARSTVWASRAACAVAVTTLQSVELVVTRLEWQLCDLCATLCTFPIALHHRALRALRKTLVIITQHRYTLRSYVLLTYDPLERNYRHQCYGVNQHGPVRLTLDCYTVVLRCSQAIVIVENSSFTRVRIQYHDILRPQ